MHDGAKKKPAIADKLLIHNPKYQTALNLSNHWQRLENSRTWLLTQMGCSPQGAEAADLSVKDQQR
jgi:hypothetical protein